MEKKSTSSTIPGKTWGFPVSAKRPARKCKRGEIKKRKKKLQ